MTKVAPKAVASQGGLRAQLMRGGFTVIVLRVSAVLAGLVASVTLARLLGPANYGIYALVFSIITLLGLPVKMGLPTLVLRETARADQAEDGTWMTGIWHWADRAMILMSVAVLLCTFGYVWLFADMTTPRTAALLYALPLIPLIGFAEVKGAAIRGLRRVGLGEFPNKVIRPLLLAGVIFVMATIRPEELEAADAFLVHAVVAAIALTIVLIILRNVRPHHPDLAGSRASSRGWLAAVVPLAAIAGLQLISHNTDILMLGALATDADVGLYRVALSGANIALFGLTAANLLLQPYFARAWQAGNLRQLQKLTTLGARVSVAATAPILLLFWLGGTALLTFVFGDAYAGAFWALILLCLGQTVSAAFGAVGSLLTMAGREKIALAGLTASTVVNVVLNWVLIPRYGIEGAAVATGISIATWNLLLWVAAWRLLRVDSSPLGLRPGTGDDKGSP